MSDDPIVNPFPSVRGVDRHRQSGKWRARIRVDRVDHNLGLFDTHAEAVAARQAAEVRLLAPPPTPEAIRADLLNRVRTLYAQQGIGALSSTFLEKQKGDLYNKLRSVGLKQPQLLAEMGVTQEEYARWADANQTYAGKSRPRWTWELAIEEAKAVKEKLGDLPTEDWFRKNGFSSLVSIVFKSGHTFEDLRRAVGCFSTSTFVESRNGLRWRSRPEACMSDFLHARGIEHKKGRAYPPEFGQRFGKRGGQYDLHFFSPIHSNWTDVEIWGDGLGKLSGGRYERTRRQKEEWRAGDPNFLGIEYANCLTDTKLTEILRPYIGDIEPHNFEKAHDRHIETAHWSNADELLKTCQQIAAMQPDGIFPGESWLRKRGKYENRDGETYNSLAVYVNRRLGGVRNVREILGQGHASTTAWTPKSLIESWRSFEQRWGYTPVQAAWRYQNGGSIEARREAAKLCAAAERQGVLDECKRAVAPSKVKWTIESTTEAWHRFVTQHGRTPSECMSASQRAKLPKAVTDEATRIYDAARRLGLLATLRGAPQPVGP